MIQSTQRVAGQDLHVGIIMDGNGRWATGRGLSRAVGHREGADAVRRVVETAPSQGIGTLTLYAFSSDNWQRPEREVAWLMRLFRQYLRTESARCAESGVRMSIIGRRDRLPVTLVRAVERAERVTAAGRRLHLRVAVDYSGRDAILRAAGCVPAGHAPSRESFGRLLDIVNHGDGSVPALDLVIRTGGEQRLSDFLLWESAYAELIFLPALWPDISATDLAAALREFRRRNRRFGALPPDASAAAAGRG